MKAGIENKILSSETTVTASKAAISGKGVNNILTPDALQIWQSEDDTILTITFDNVINIECICLFNVTLETDLDIELYDAGLVLIASYTKTPNDLTGFQIKNTFVEFTAVDVKRIILNYNSTTVGFLNSLGYIWAGDLVDFGCVENIVPRDIVADQATDSRAQTRSIKEEYYYQSYDFTTGTQNYQYLEFRDSIIRPLIIAGWYTPRPFVINENKLFSTTPELLFAGFDAGRVQYDINPDEAVNIGGSYHPQTTLGITEVFGQNGSR